MNIKEALKYMNVEKAIELEDKRFFCNSDETVNAIAIYSMGKQIPVKPVMIPDTSEWTRFNWVCEMCGIPHYDNRLPNYCDNCGKRVDWSIEKFIQENKKYFPELME